MQFVGAKGRALFLAVVVIAWVVGFGPGLLIGRHYPARSFQKFGETRYLLDPATGRVCDPFKDPKEDPFAQFAVDPNTGKTPAEVSGIVKPMYPLACGK
jgi:hypothetical protein